MDLCTYNCSQIFELTWHLNFRGRVASARHSAKGLNKSIVMISFSIYAHLSEMTGSFRMLVIHFITGSTEILGQDGLQLRLEMGNLQGVRKLAVNDHNNYLYIMVKSVVNLSKCLAYNWSVSYVKNQRIHEKVSFIMFLAEFLKATFIRD